MKYQANWKMLPENSLEGSYHGHFIHKFAFDLFDSRSGRDRMELDEDRHAICRRPHGRRLPRRAVPSASGALSRRKAYVETLIKTYGAERTESLTSVALRSCSCFPI